MRATLSSATLGDLSGNGGDAGDGTEGKSGFSGAPARPALEAAGSIFGDLGAEDALAPLPPAGGAAAPAAAGARPAAPGLVASQGDGEGAAALPSAAAEGSRPPDGEVESGERAFLVAPKRGRRGRPLLERPTRQDAVPAPGPAGPSKLEGAAPASGPLFSREENDTLDDPGTWCQASSSSAPPLRQWQPRAPRSRPRGRDVVASRVTSVPSWAQWPGAQDDSPRKGDDADHWDISPGVPFQRICIGFKDPGEELEDEATTCEGEEPEEEASDWDDLDALASEVVIGYRAEVGPGHGLPAPSSEEATAFSGEDRHGLEGGLAQGGTAGGAAEAEGGAAAREAGGDNEALDDLGSPLAPGAPVTHVLFVVHGMGATPEALRKNKKDLRENFGAMQKYWFWHTDANVHVEIIDWKSALSAEQSAIFDRITPAEARTTRMSLNATLSDVIFYKTAHHRTKIHDIVTRKMNTRLRALRAEPNGRCANARVSVVGHSLGSVIAYDVLSGFGVEEGGALEFEVDSYFLWGSPLAAFISIADIEHQSGKFTLPGRISTYNIFHPHDPVAFRLEPLYYHDQDQIVPETIPHWVNNGIEPSMQWVRSYEYAKVLANRKWAALKNRVWQAVGASAQPDVSRLQWDSYVNSDPDSPCLLATNSRVRSEVVGQEEEEEEPEETLLGPRMRIDYALQEHLVEGYVESYALLQSHFCYWTSHDVALFMLKKLSQQEVAELSYAQKEQQEAAALTAAEAAPAAGGADGSESEGPAAEELPDGGSGARAALSLLPTLPQRAELLRRLVDMPCLGQRAGAGRSGGVADPGGGAGPDPYGYRPPSPLAA